jgi:hypothetical protein
MTLEYQIDTLDGIEDTTAALYIETDGKFILDVSGHDSAAAKNKIPRARLNQEIEKRKNAEAQLFSVAEDLKAELPDEMQGLIPDLPPDQLISWIQKMSASGIFDTKEPKPIDNKKPGDKKPVDFEGMTPQSIMATGYKT